MAGFFEKLKEQVFGKTEEGKPVARRQSPDGSFRELLPEPETIEPEPPSPPARPEREPYLVQVGFDFGTAFSKCVCRDVFLDKAWIHSPSDQDDAEMPFLIASAVRFDGECLSHPSEATGAYEDGGLYHVKMALEKIALKEWEDPVLKSYRAASGNGAGQSLANFVELCAIYLLAGALGEVKREVRERFPGDVEGDFLAVNMAVPVANADHPGVNTLFDRILRRAWVTADQLAGHPEMAISELANRIAKSEADAESETTTRACFIYPEVSANVQGFVRSRTSREGIYLFSDTGAGTVDQSVFLFARPNGQDHLTYLHAGVFPLGSSHLERIAAEKDGNESWENLEHWRQRKEAGESAGSLQFARRRVGADLKNGTAQTISLSKRKLKRRQQINGLRVIFGGGGHCENPYRLAVIDQFDGNIFHPDEIQARRRAGESFDLGMPIPRDLDLKDEQRRWMDRLTVAYGLSFEQGDLATFTLPKEVEIPSEEQLWRPTRRIRQAPSKDEV